MRSWQLGFCLLALCLWLQCANTWAVALHPDQRAIMLQIVTECPQLGTLSNGVWNNNTLNYACDRLVYGVLECNEDGWVTRMEFGRYNELCVMPPSFANMAYLEELVIRRAFRGPAIQEWSGMTRMKRLIFDYIPGALGAIPDAWQALESLEELEMFSENFPPAGTGYWGLPTWIPTFWKNFKKLRYRVMSNGSGFPNHLAELPMLEELNLEANHFSGTISEAWANHSSISIFKVNQNELRGVVPADWSLATNLTIFNLASNKFEGPLPELWPENSKLREISVLDNRFNGTIPQSIMDLPNLRLITAYSNRLSGNIPWTSIERVATSKLDEIVLDQNLLTGTLPAYFWRFPNLQILDISSNMIGGTIPNNVNPDCRMIQLRASKTLLSGPIPSRLDHCLQFREIIIEHANLTGGIPSTMMNMPSWGQIKFSNNSLSGPLPSNWSTLTSLTSLRLYQNDFSGTIPIQLMELSNLRDVIIHANHFDLCGNPLIFNDTMPADWSCTVGEQTPTPCGCEPGTWTQCGDSWLDYDACPPGYQAPEIPAPIPDPIPEPYFELPDPPIEAPVGNLDPFFSTPTTPSQDMVPTSMTSCSTHLGGWLAQTPGSSTIKTMLWLAALFVATIL